MLSVNKVKIIVRALIVDQHSYACLADRSRMDSKPSKFAGFNLFRVIEDHNMKY